MRRLISPGASQTIRRCVEGLHGVSCHLPMCINDPILLEHESTMVYPSRYAHAHRSESPRLRDEEFIPGSSALIIA